MVALCRAAEHGDRPAPADRHERSGVSRSASFTRARANGTAIYRAETRRLLAIARSGAQRPGAKTAVLARGVDARAGRKRRACLRSATGAALLLAARAGLPAADTPAVAGARLAAAPAQPARGIHRDPDGLSGGPEGFRR